MATEANIINPPPAQTLGSIKVDTVQKSIKMILSGRLVSEIDANVLLNLGIGYYKDYTEQAPQDIALTRAGILFAKNFCEDLNNLNRDLNTAIFSKKVHSISDMDVFRIHITEIGGLLKYTGKYMICLAPISRISTDLQFIYIYC